MSTLSAGIHPDIAASIYHADELSDRPALNASTIKLLIDRSPWHAWTRHPKLNPEWRPHVDEKFDLGTAAHELLLRKNDELVEVINADSWRSNAAKEARDEARAAGRVPLLVDQWERVQEMVDAVRVQIDTLEIEPPLLTDGKPEQTIVWEHDGVLLKARLDWLRDDLAAIDDLKTTLSTGNPHDWSRRTFWAIGADVQAVLYQRGIRALTGRDIAFRFIVAEAEPPYAVSVVDLAPSAVAIADRKIDYAIGLWRRCLADDDWPGYPGEVASVEVDSWQEADLLRRTYQDDAA